jgi:hypothetical protein
MRVFHARLHQARLGYVLAREVEVGQVSAIVLIRCPGCRAPYVLEVERSTTSWALRAAERAVFARLLADCPDHVHRFEVSTS